MTPKLIPKIAPIQILKNSLKDNILSTISFQIKTVKTQTAKSLTPKLGVSISTVKRELKELQIKGYLEHIGPSNGGYWKVLIKK